MKKQKLIKKLGVALLITVVTTILFTALAAWNPLNKWQLKLTNHLYDRNEASEDIVIVAIDENSLDEEEGLGKWQDWDRSYYSEAIKNLEENGAKVIAMDVIFSEPSEGISEGDLQTLMSENFSYEDAFKATYDYIETPHPDDQEFGEVLEQYDNIILIADSQTTEKTNIVTNSILPLEEFRDNSELAWVKAYLDEDDVLRRVYTKFYSEEEGEWSGDFGTKVVELYKDGVVPETDEEILINYAAPPYSYKMVPFVDAYNGYLEGVDLEGKIVLIGATATRLNDNYSTPTSPLYLMPGVEIRANEIQTILEENYLLEQSVTAQALLIAFLTFVLVAGVMFLPVLGGVAATAVIITGHQLSGGVFFDYGLILNLVYPTLALLAAYLGTTLFKYMTEIKEKTRIKGAFGKYVNKDLANKILDNPAALKLGGEKRIITVFFSDIADFTHFSEQVEPEALVAQLNEYFEVMAGVILQNEGNLNKFEGDAIMAFWGAPLDQPDHAIMAAKSALACRAALTGLHTKWQAENKPLLNFRVGLSTGEVIAGNVGSQERFDYTVMGDIVNLGARLESANKEYGTHIMIPGATVAGLGDAFDLRRLDKLRVKGKDEPVDVYELIAVKGQLTDQHRAIVEQFHQAIEYYRNQKFAEAEKRFQEILKLAPNDGPTQTYITRCQHFKANPPQGWDATWTLDHK